MAKARHRPGPGGGRDAAATQATRQADGRAAVRRRWRPGRHAPGRGGRGGSAGGDAGLLAEPASSGSPKKSAKNAKLPLPPEQDSQVQVLLRPGPAGRRRDHRREDSRTRCTFRRRRSSRRTASTMVYVQQERQVRAAPSATGQAERIHDGAVRRREAGRDRRHGRSDRRQGQEEEGREEVRAAAAPMGGMPAGGNRHGTFALSFPN